MNKVYSNILIVCMGIFLLSHELKSVKLKTIKLNYRFAFKPDDGDKVGLFEKEKFESFLKIEKTLVEKGDKPGVIDKISFVIKFDPEVPGWLEFTNFGETFSFYLSYDFNFENRRQNLELAVLEFRDIKTDEKSFQWLSQKPNSLKINLVIYAAEIFKKSKRGVFSFPFIGLPHYDNALNSPDDISSIYYKNKVIMNELNNPIFNIDTNSFVPFSDWKDASQEHNNTKSILKESIIEDFVYASVIIGLKTCFITDTGLPENDLIQLKSSLYPIFYSVFKEVISPQAYLNSITENNENPFVNADEFVNNLNLLLSESRKSLLLNIAEYKFFKSRFREFFPYPLYYNQDNWDPLEQKYLINYYLFWISHLLPGNIEEYYVTFDRSGIHDKVINALKDQNINNLDKILKYIPWICHQIGIHIDVMFHSNTIQRLGILKQLPGLNEFLTKYLSKAASGFTFERNFSSDENSISKENMDRLRNHFDYDSALKVKNNFNTNEDLRKIHYFLNSNNKDPKPEVPAYIPLQVWEFIDNDRILI